MLVGLYLGSSLRVVPFVPLLLPLTVRAKKNE